MSGIFHYLKSFFFSPQEFQVIEKQDTPTIDPNTPNSSPSKTPYLDALLNGLTLTAEQTKSLRNSTQPTQKIDEFREYLEKL
jgi:hypothetical protein